jgi:uncharacterized membrane protein
LIGRRHNVAVTNPETDSRPSAERLVFFTDAIAAIALTLLILPLLETVTGAGEGTGSEQVTLGRLVHQHIGDFGSFVLSFAVIFRLWWSHHRMFQHVETLRPALVRANLIWTFAIVVLPISTAVIIAFPPSAGSVALYGGTLALGSGTLTVMSLIVYRHPELSEGRPRGTREEVLQHLTNFCVQVLSTVIGAVFYEHVNYWAFLLMFLTGPIESRIRARWAKAPAA